MARKAIYHKTVAEETANHVDIRIINMPLYPDFTSSVDIFYGYYKEGRLRIENSIAEGNITLGNVISSSYKTDLLNAIIAQVGAVTEAHLEYHQLSDSVYVIHYKKADGTNTIVSLTGNYFSTTEEDAIKSTVLTQLSASENISGWWGKRKSFVVNSTTSQTNYPVTITIYKTTGVSTSSTVYIGNNVRSDWGDVRIYTGTTALPYAIVRSDTNSITITFSAPSLSIGDNTFYLYYNRPQVVSPYKIACLTDTHYDPLTSSFNRDQTLNYIDSFVTRMSTYLPDLAVNNGDKTGATSSTEGTQLSWYQSNIDHFAAVSSYATVVKDGVAPGNHDFEFMQFSNVVAKHTGEAWLESGKLYGYWESTDYRFIALDSNYQPSTQTHLTLQHNGYGYINTDQITWLESCLAASTKPCIIFCHHPLSEMDTAEYTLTKEIYHTQNRSDVRAVIEASNKVLCVLHGHVHWARVDFIKSIPYICMEDISESSTLGHELPVGTQGKWALIEIDKESKNIRFKTEYKVSGVVQVAYDYTIPFNTSFDSDIAHHPEMAFANSYAATFGKSNYIADPCQIYINDYTFINTITINQLVPDPYLSPRSFKIEGLQSTPNFGRATWDFAPQTAKFKMIFSARLTATTTKYFKLIDTSNSTPGVYVGFKSNGNIFAYNSASVVDLMAYSINTWYEFKIIVDTVANTYSFYVDGVLKANNYAFNNANTTLKQLEIVTETGSVFLDNVRVQKYTSTEPTITSWGNEQLI